MAMSGQPAPSLAAAARSPGRLHGHKAFEFVSCNRRQPPRKAPQTTVTKGRYAYLENGRF
jgi:hypothetical protein